MNCINIESEIVICTLFLGQNRLQVISNWLPGADRYPEASQSVTKTFPVPVTKGTFLLAASHRTYPKPLSFHSLLKLFYIKPHRSAGRLPFQRFRSCGFAESSEFLGTAEDLPLASSVSSPLSLLIFLVLYQLGALVAEAEGQE